MRSLSLGSNTFSSSIPSTLTRLTGLLILNLSSNSLTGPLPVDIGKWKVLTSMDLSNNHFSSDIPVGVADLKDLTQFSLSNNRLTGPIPESFGDMLSLEFLDLSRNNLSGEIPMSLEKLRYLRSFNVSFNRLHGKIPEGGSFEKYSIESFKGNEALCGAPQFHLPSCKSKSLKNSKARIKLMIYVAPPIASTFFVVALIFILRSRKRKNKLPNQEDLLPLGAWRRISFHELHQATDGFSESRLLDEDMVAHLSDFSIAKLLCQEDSMIQTMTMATIGYIAPEYGIEGIVSTKGDKSLRNWVKELIYATLLSSIGREHSAANSCALSILQVGLQCSTELPDERIDMIEVLTKLKKIKVKLLKDTELVQRRSLLI
ncbi:hypothetical protein V6N13_063639 [Hibiscus sabdariffa]|uniref:Uncharacterized protein n=1 Tax=Hibiscus sabdariffa TaxID=183260 RepID=A0ABR2R154_9ROSI